MNELADQLLHGRKLGVVDVGATGGLFPHAARVAAYVDALGFDPDEAECARLNAEAQTAGLAQRFLPYAVTGEDGERTLHVTRKPSSSSLHPANAAYHARFPDAARMDVVGSVTVTTRSLGGVLDELGFAMEVLKLDVHGAEPEILQSLRREQWQSLLAVYTELLIGPQYEGQASFSDTDPILRAHGFELFHLQRHSSRRASFDVWHHSSRGQLEFVDAFYLRTDGGDPRRLAFVASLFGHHDVALDLLEGDPAAAAVRRLAVRPGPLVRRLATWLIGLGERGRRLYGATGGWWSTDGPTDPL